MPPYRMTFLPLKRVVGLGDLVKKATDAFGIEACGSCEERRRRMNQMLEFGSGDAPCSSCDEQRERESNASLVDAGQPAHSD